MANDFNIMDHLSRQGGGFSGGQAKGPPSDGTNEKSTVDAVLEASGKPSYYAARAMGIPVNVTEWGQHGLQKAIGGDTEGVAGKMILPGGLMADAQGGFLARLLYDIFVKNREITDHTQIPGGGDFAAATGSGDFSGGGFDGGASGFSDAFLAQGNFSDLVGAPTGSYDWNDIPLAMLGDLPRPATPDMRSGAAIEIG